MTPEAIMPLNVDSTMITCARSCLEKFRLEFVYGFRPEGISIDLHAGACFATGIEATRKHVYQENKTLNDALLSAHAAFQVAWGDFEIPEYKKTAKTRERVWEAIEDYFRKYPPLTDHIQPYYVGGKPTFEFTFAIPLEPCAPTVKDISIIEGKYIDGGKTAYHSYDPDDHKGLFPLHPNGEPWLYSGRFDMFGEYMKKPVVLDEKTTGSSISTGWSDKWTLRNQFLGYVWACQQLGIALDSVAVRGIAIQKTQIGHAEAIKPYSQHLLDIWHETLRRDLWRIRKAWDTGYFDLNLADACTSYGNCIFMNICASHPSMKENWFNDFEVRRWNPLHKNPIAEPAK